ncbi:MAG: P-loop NTPase [Candidatus Cloacimonetes bacterium]|jgi:RecA/RadA recombinase|nr:P-loop NTPase [Candidatus Cloacimonadota bacterium]
MKELKKIIIICGHYGSGKTTFAMNLAVNMKKEGKDVTLVDMDIVNPYFRSSDYTAFLESVGIKVIAPAFAGTNLDTPVILPDVYSVFESAGYVIIDAGGDDAGAMVLGQFFRNIKDREYDMLYVINKYRSLISDPKDSAQVLKQIEYACRLKVTYIVNNSHLKSLSTPDTVRDSLDYADKTSELLNLPILCTTIPKEIYDNSISNNIKPITDNLYPIETYVRTPWGS